MRELLKLYGFKLVTNSKTFEDVANYQEDESMNRTRIAHALSLEEFEIGCSDVVNNSSNMEEFKSGLDDFILNYVTDKLKNN